jgi:hypothetical protein
MLELIWIGAIGAVTGALAKFIIPGAGPGGFFVTAQHEKASGLGRSEWNMGILDELLGGGQRQRDFRDFVSRYEQGHPSEGYSDQEVVERYRDVAHAVPPDQYAQAAQEALARLSPQERAAFVTMLQERAQARGAALPQQIGSEPWDLGQVLTNLHQKPGQLRDLLGGGEAQARAEGSSAITNILASPLAKAALAGIAAMVVRRVMQGPGR